MSSIAYRGHDFSPYASAELLAPAPLAVEPRAVPLAGRAGAVLLGGEVPPRVLRVRLFLDMGASCTDAERAEVRHVLAGWLLAPGGGKLIVPGDPEMTYRDAVVTGGAGWETLFEDGSCEVEFTCYDPYGYGESAETAGTVATVGGNAPTWPAFELTASGGASLKVSHTGTGEFILLEGPFTAGDKVRLDCADENALLGSQDARAMVVLESTFFSFVPGDNRLAFSGCSAHRTTWHERWV